MIVRKRRKRYHMGCVVRYAQSTNGIAQDELEDMVTAIVHDMAAKRKIRKVLLLPPDYTRVYSGSGKITVLFYKTLQGVCGQIDVMPAVGTHDAMTEDEIKKMFEGVIPVERVIYHHWREDVIQIGRIPGGIVREISGGILGEPIDVEVNFRLMDPSYDVIISIGQVVPHEVAGMANYSKNVFIGCGGPAMISKTHILGALCGVEHVVGREDTAVRQLFDYAEENFLKRIPLLYVLTVSGQESAGNCLQGVFIGRGRELFEKAVKLSLKKNITYIDKAVSKVVAYMDEDEYKSTWVSNKAIYRSRLALSRGGELVIIAPGVRKFGEDLENDELIRRYGYQSSSCIKRLCQQGGPLSHHLSVAAHLLQGTANGEFKITYATKFLSKKEIEGVKYQYMPLCEAINQFKPKNKETGYYRSESGEEYFFIRHPASGLWIANDTESR